jgi:hypothetical protein
MLGQARGGPTAPPQPLASVGLVRVDADERLWAYDFELVPAAPGEMRITVRAAVGTVLASIPIRVR